MTTKPLSDFPILAEEIELAEGYQLQRRLSGCGTMGVLTIKAGESVVLFGVLDSLKSELADCVDQVKAAISSRNSDRAPETDNLDVVHWDCDVIVANATQETEFLNDLHAAVRKNASAEAIANARRVIGESREKIERQRRVMEFAEKQILQCEENIVLSQLMIEFGGEDAEHTRKSTQQEIQTLTEKRLALREEERVIREAESALASSVAALPQD